ncbi:MAG: transposase family protein [Planctomycetia bacterium]|nr:MAG: transposase family protein [Planctomycetia bacterium]QOJ07138.1 MAG: transposase family protein [Planctomycetia bacterium]
MITLWEKRDDCWTNTSSPGFYRDLTYGGNSEINALWLSGLRGSKKTICGRCGAAHRSHYDKKEQQTRDLSCGDARIYLEAEVRRVKCKKCGTVKREKLPWRRILFTRSDLPTM